MATLWIDSDCLSVGDVGFLIEAVDNNRGGTTHRFLDEVPLHTNMSHEPRLRGWGGETNNISRTAMGMARVSRVAKNGRVCLTMLEAGSSDEAEALETLGYPDLAK